MFKKKSLSNYIPKDKSEDMQTKTTFFIGQSTNVCKNKFLICLKYIFPIY